MKFIKLIVFIGFMGGIAMLLSGNKFDGFSFNGMSQSLGNISDSVNLGPLSGIFENMQEAFEFLKVQAEKLLNSGHSS